MSHAMLIAKLSAVVLPMILVQPAVAQVIAHHEPGVVVTIADWSARMNRELERQLRSAPTEEARIAKRGLVRVKFNCSENGRPDKVELLRGSGNRALDRDAMRAVKRMASLHPMPTGFRREQKYEAVIVFATTPEDRNIAASGSEQLARNAWYHDTAVASN